MTFFKLTRQLSETAFDQVGQLNPQLLREWQGRLKWRNLILTGLLSVVAQGVLMLKTLVQLPTHENSGDSYCILLKGISRCRLGQWDEPLINWPFVWADIFRDASFVMVWVLIFGGVYLLAADLSKESRRGTLNFLRMSPLPGRKILIGKLWGVPALLYVGVGSMLPLHIGTGMLAGYPAGRLGLFYILLGAIAFCYYGAALWFALLAEKLQGFQTWVISGLSAGLLVLGWEFEHYKFSGDWFRFFNPLHILSDWEVKGLDYRTTWAFNQGEHLRGFRDLAWFFQPVGDHANVFWAFALANAIGLGLWFWMVLERKFQTPIKTAISKRQSYGLTLFFSTLVIGFDMQFLPKSPDIHFSRSLMDIFWSYGIAMMIWHAALMFLLLPARQTLLDWTRYRHQQPRESLRASIGYEPEDRLEDRETAHKSAHKSTGNSLILDLLLNDNSPSTVAYFVNLAITGGVLLPGICLYRSVGRNIALGIDLWGWVLCAFFLLACALIVQLISLANLVHWRWIALGAITAAIVGWPTILAMLMIENGSGFLRHLWLITAFPFYIVDDASYLGLGCAIALHLTLLTTLSLLLTRRCQILGRSEWKALVESTHGPERRESPTRKSLTA
ncbi:MAG: hypothetical protein AAGJ95_09875 [Cyanobacteria bacterium J06554_11]